MKQEARKQLNEIVKRYGIEILNEPKKVEGLLRDFCGDCKKEIFSIVSALKEGVANDLASSTKGSTTKLMAVRLCKKLQDDLALSEEASIWSVESIAISLGIMSEKEATVFGKTVEPKSAEINPGTARNYDNRENEIKTSNGDELIYVEGGTFIMGDTWGDGDDNEKPTHKVELTYDFYVGKYPVTFDEYDRYCIEANAAKPEDEGRGRGKMPVIYVSWFDAIEYCNWLSEKEGLPISYFGDGSLLDENSIRTEDITRVKGYRLLTEAEWEYAARGGRKSMGYKYSGSNNPDSVAWYESNSERMRHEVGQKKRNELGLYDMSGNVLEWCSDCFGDYSGSVQKNLYNNSGSFRVYRGGFWLCSASGVRVAYRDYNLPAFSNFPLGFRITRTVH
ncbi:SUMF1/EgtB/PvdO family nonheme iron enzyme [uncultured Mesotoga sp.]|uniref:formylglycine-generating enzyme family protein n=1 Tax=uncultured Mesotoga sp. TaxID=1184400 RepID=UPI00259644C1|nr:SUMF1/EgtB/PvdO family nonheme iron enzyme [uncultured Mesotoga sp.]